jgi:hypothetical protein
MEYLLAHSGLLKELVDGGTVPSSLQEAATLLLVDDVTVLEQLAALPATPALGWDLYVEVEAAREAQACLGSHDRYVVLRREADRVCLPLAHLHALDDLALRWAAALDGTWCEHVCDAWERWRSARVAEVRAWGNIAIPDHARLPHDGQEEWFELRRELLEARPGSDLSNGDLGVALGVARARDPHHFTSATVFFAGWFGRLDILRAATPWATECEPSPAVAMCGRLDVLQEMLARFGHQTRFRKELLARFAAYAGHTHVLDWLFACGWNPTVPCGIEYAVGRGGHMPVLDWLRAHHAAVDLPDLFHGAAIHGHTAMLEKVLDLDASAITSDVIADALETAAGHDATETFEVVAHRFPSVSFRGHLAEVAGMNDSVRVLQWLQEHGVPLTPRVISGTGPRCLRYLHTSGDLQRLWQPEFWVNVLTHHHHNFCALIPWLRDEVRLEWDVVLGTQAVLHRNHMYQDTSIEELTALCLAGFPLDASPPTLALALNNGLRRTEQWLREGVASQSNLS